MLPARRFAPLALVSPPSRRAPEPEYLNRPGIISESTRAGSYGTHALRHPLHGPGTASGATWATFGTGCVLLSCYFRRLTPAVARHREGAPETADRRGLWPAPRRQHGPRRWRHSRRQGGAGRKRPAASVRPGSGQPFGGAAAPPGGARLPRSGTRHQLPGCALPLPGVSVTVVRGQCDGSQGVRRRRSGSVRFRHPCSIAAVRPASAARANRYWFTLVPIGGGPPAAHRGVVTHGKASD